MILDYSFQHSHELQEGPYIIRPASICFESKVFEKNPGAIFVFLSGTNFVSQQMMRMHGHKWEIFRETILVPRAPRLF